MHFDLERLNWMPSPPIVPEDSAIDIQHLSRMTLGETALQIEVLTLFAAQSRDLAARIASAPADILVLAHTLKGSARAIGAFRVADAAFAVETAVKSGGDVSDAVTALRTAVDEACAAIASMIGRG